MATFSTEKLWIFLIIIQACLIGKCEAYSTTWWSVWYFWVVLFGVLACCCGAAGSYYRRRQYATIRRTQHTVVVGTVPSGTGQVNQAPVMYPPYSSNPSDQYAPPTYPTNPVQPPAYSEGLGNQGYNQGENKDYVAPPAYSEVVAPGTASK